MDLLPDEAQQGIIDATASYLDDAMPIDRLRGDGASAARPSDEQWQEIAELGWLGLSISEERGGVGFSLVEEALLFREVGRRVGAVQLLATAVGSRVAAAAGDDGRLRDLIAGRVRVGWAEPLGEIDLKGRLTGELQVYDGAGAGLCVVVGASGAALLDAVSLRAEPRPCLDESTDLSRASVSNATPIVRVDADAGVFDCAAVLAAAMLSGIAEAARDQAAAYAQERIQFGRPIGVYQAIKHRCADMAVRCEAAWSQTAYAALATRDGLADAPFQVSAGKHLAGEAASENAAANVQVHGGYGFTTECDAHLLVKRTHVLNAIAGTPRRHLRRLLDAPAAG